MNEEIELGNKKYTLEIDPERYGYKDGVLYKVHKTTKSVMAMGCIGAMRFVFDKDGNMLAESYPMMNLNNGFDFVTSEQLIKSEKILAAYDKLQEENLKD